jgi:tetratricopeptide (TPR) repeat protein
MANFFDEKQVRNVLPNWRSFVATAQLGELSISSMPRVNARAEVEFSERLLDWQSEQNIGVACDVINTALFYNKTKSPEVISIAKYILNNSHLASNKIVEIANAIVSNQPIVKTHNSSEILQFESIAVFDEKNYQMIHSAISLLKKQIRNNPRNAITWIELARAYSMIGLLEKAKDCIHRGVYLGSENRYILRSLARFAARKQSELPFAHDTIRKSQIIKRDPWVLTAEIAVANLRGRRSVFVKNGIEMASDSKFNPFHISELSSAVGTIELENGAIKKGRIHLERSLIMPNDNSLAQVEWASNTHKILTEFNPANFNNVQAYEALARDAFEKGDFKEAINYCAQWFLDLPYSKQPVLFASYIAETLLDDHEWAIRIGSKGLVSHPGDSNLLNNIAYANCMLGKLDEADDALTRAEANFGAEITDAYLVATRGLYYYRKGIPQLGRLEYIKAVEILNKNSDKTALQIALGNMAREELMLKSEDSVDMAERFLKITEANESLQIKKLRNQILKLHRNRNFIVDSFPPQ